MFTIVYASRATQPMTDAALARLLQTAHRRNAVDDLTGMLLYAQQSFLQQLEGEESALDEVYAAISADPRHTDIRVLSRREVSDRRFPDWAMGFEHPDEASLREHLPAYRPSAGMSLISAELVRDAEMAEALLGAYAIGLRA